MEKDTTSLRGFFMETAAAYINFTNSGGTNLREFMRQELEQAGVYRGDNELNDAIKEIEATFSQIDDNHREIHDYKKRGRSVSRWLEEKIGKLQSIYTPQDKSEVPKIIHQSMNKATSELLQDADFIEGPIQLEQPASYTFEDLNKKAVSQSIYRSIGQSMALDLADEESDQANYVEGHPAAGVFKDYITSKLGESSPAEAAARTIVTTSAIKAAEAGFTPLVGKSASEIAVMVDNGLTRIKIGYKVASGELNVPDAIEYSVDRAAARAEVLVSEACRKAGRFIGEKVGSVIGSAFGPVGKLVGGTVGKFVGDIVGQQIGEQANTGVRRVAEVAKEVCTEAWNGVKATASKAWSGIKSFFGFGR